MWVYNIHKGRHWAWKYSNKNYATMLSEEKLWVQKRKKVKNRVWGTHAKISSVSYMYPHIKSARIKQTTEAHCWINNTNDFSKFD